jgi:PqqD family protein of HPr-rel-A system
MTKLCDHECRFQFRLDINLLYHEYDDGVVLFDPATSNTTLFNPIVVWLIETVTTLPFDQATTLEQLVKDYHDDNADELAQLLGKALASLHELGFIKRT